MGTKENNKDRLVAYLAKFDKNKDNPLWQKDPNVMEVSSGGIIDIQRVRKLFDTRRVMTPPEFDQALQDLKLSGLLDPVTGLPNAETLNKFAELDATRQEEERISNLAKEI